VRTAGGAASSSASNWPHLGTRPSREGSTSAVSAIAPRCALHTWKPAPTPPNMSDSEADIPSEASITRALRDVVISIHTSGNSDDLTVKRVRTRAEEELGLPAGFFKNHDWKQKSHELIHEAVVCTHGS
jgi:hypothetical protein